MSGARATRCSQTANIASTATPAMVGASHAPGAPAEGVGAHDPIHGVRSSPSVIRIAPLRSKCRTSSRLVSWIRRRPRTTTMSPIGTLTRKMDDQPAVEVSTPPMSTPAERPGPTSPPDPHGAIALGPLGERRREDGQGGRGHNRPGDPLQRPRADEQAPATRRWRRRARRWANAVVPSRNMRATPEQVGRAAAEHEEPGERRACTR